MAKVCVVPKEDWAVVKKYVEDGNILIPENVLGEISPERAEQLRALDGQIVDYDFGGEPECCIDIIHSEESYAYSAILGLNEQD